MYQGAERKRARDRRARGPCARDRRADLAGRHVGDELRRSGAVGDLDTGLLQDAGVGPQHVGAVSVDRDRVVLAVLLKHRLDRRGKLRLPALGRVEVGDVGDASVLDRRHQVLVGVQLPGVGRVAALEPGREHRAGVGSAASRYGGVLEGHIGRRRAEGLLEHPERLGLGSGGPSGEDFETLTCPTALGRAGPAGSSASGGQQRHGDRQRDLDTRVRL